MCDYWQSSALNGYPWGDYYAIITSADEESIFFKENAHFANNQQCNYTKTIIHLAFGE